MLPVWKGQSFSHGLFARKGGIKPISIVQELPTESSESNDELFVIEEVGTLKHD